ncbi:MAG: hypothetical protein ACR2P4_07735 [Gammaproteobacteria bacterium]
MTIMATKQNDTAENKTPKPRPPKKGGGWFWLLLVIFAGGGGVYLANTAMVQKIAGKLGWQVAAHTKAQPAPPDEDTNAPPLPQVAVLPPDLHAPNAPYDSPYEPANDTRQNDNADNNDNAADVIGISAQLASINRRLDVMAQNDDDNTRQRRQLQDRLYQLEQRAANDNDDSQSIQLTDIALRATGNASAAAAALESLAARAETIERRTFLLAEARRLKDAPDRKDITAAIHQLRALLRDIGDISADGNPSNAALAMVFSLLKVQKITTAQSRAKGLDDALARMEWLIVVGRDGEYLRELDSAAARWQNAKDKSDNGDIARLFGKLREMGAPKYQISTGGQL